MTALKTIALAIEVATQKRDQAGKSLVQAQRAYLSAESQMEQLKNYAEETASKWATGAQAQTSAELLRHHSQFMNRLQQAINLQAEVLENEARRVDAAKRLTLDAESRLAGLKQMLKKKQMERARVQARREQRQTDEVASMLRHRMVTNGESP